MRPGHVFVESVLEVENAARDLEFLFREHCKSVRVRRGSRYV